MLALDVIGWIAALGVLGSYWYMYRTNHILQFDVMNFITAFPLVAVGLAHGAYPPAVISAAFGVIGFMGAKARLGKAHDRRKST